MQQLSCITTISSQDANINFSVPKIYQTIKIHGDDGQLAVLVH